MNLSPNGLSILKQFESLCLAPYNDAVGNATVGWGHLLHPGPLNGTESPITEAEADSLLALDVRDKAETHVNRIAAPLNQNQYDALCIFCFNVGLSNLRRVASETGLYGTSPDYATVPRKILLYNKARNQDGQLVVLPGLTRRRQAEADLWNKPA